MTNRIFTPIMSIAFGIAMAIACKKGPTANDSISPDQLNLRASSPCAGGIKKKTCGGTILAFQDQAAFQATYDCLLNEYNNYNDDVEATYAYLTDEDAYNDMLNSLGLDEEQPFIDFEQSLAHNSYRAKFAALEDAWLAAGADDNNDPDDDNWIDDPVLATIVNSIGAYQVGSVIYWISPEGDWYEITNGDCAELATLMHDPGHAGPYVHKIEVYCAPECYCKKTAKSVETDPGYKKAKQKVSHTCGSPLGNPVHRVVQKSYKKYLGLFWGRFRTKQAIDLVATPYNPDDCTPQTPYDEPGSFSKRWRKARAKELYVWEHGCLYDGSCCGRFRIYGGTNLHCINY